MGPFPIVSAQKKFLLVATNYFRKWVEIEVFAIIKDKNVTRFLQTNIIFCFGIPKIIIFDNEPQFDSSNYIKFCAKLGIRNLYSSSCYRQANEQAETTNKSLLDVLKKRLQGASGCWVEKLLGLLWAHRTTRWLLTRKTHFSLAYGMEVVIPTEIGMPTLRTTQEPADNKEIEVSLDWVDELRETVLVRMEVYRHQAMTQYNKQLKP